MFDWQKVACQTGSRSRFYPRTFASSIYETDLEIHKHESCVTFQNEENFETICLTFADTNLADFPELENTMIAFTSGL